MVYTANNIGYTAINDDVALLLVRCLIYSKQHCAIILSSASYKLLFSLKLQYVYVTKPGTNTNTSVFLIILCFL